MSLPLMIMETVPRGNWGVERKSKKWQPAHEEPSRAWELSGLRTVSEWMSQHEKSQRRSRQLPRGLPRAAFFTLSLPQDVPEDLLGHTYCGSSLSFLVSRSGWGPGIPTSNEVPVSKLLLVLWPYSVSRLCVHPPHSSSFLQLHHEEAAETPAILAHGSWNYFRFWIKLGGLVPDLGSLGPEPYLDEEPTVSVAVPCGCLQGNHLNKRHLFRCTLWWLFLIPPLLEHTNVIWPLRSKGSEWLDGRTSHQTKLVCNLTEDKALFCQDPEARALCFKATRLNTPSLILYHLGGVTISLCDSPYHGSVSR